MNVRSVRLLAGLLCAATAFAAGCGRTSTPPGSDAGSVATVPGPYIATTVPGPDPGTTVPGPDPATTVPGPDPATTVPGPDPATTVPGPDPATATQAETGGTTASETATESVLPIGTNDMPAGVVLGPLGWTELQLGMAPEAAAGLGLFSDTPLPAPDGACVEWPAVATVSIESVVVSPTLGVVAIVPRSDAAMFTLELVTFGSSVDEVAQAYPDFDPAAAHVDDGVAVQAIGNPQGQYRLQFGDDDTVSYFALELTDQNCYS